ncbi:MAG: CHAT domain-containing tetratricopeptide repeat protein [Bacteroidota bacterium]
MSFTQVLSAQSSEAVQKDSLLAKGLYYYDQVNYAAYSPDSNIYFIEQAQPFFQEIEEWSYYVNCFNYLSSLNYLREDFKATQLYSNLALKAAEKYLDRNDGAYSYALASSASILAAKGHYLKAIGLYQNSIDIQINDRKFLIGIATSYQNIGWSYRAMGDYDEALYYYRKVLPILSDTLGEKSKNSAAIYMEMANCYKSKSEYQSAIDLYHQSLEVLEYNGLQGEYLKQIEFYCYQGLANIYMELGNAEKWKQYADKAIKVQQNFDFNDECLSYELMGKLYQQRGNFRRAYGYFDQALSAATREVTGYDRHPKIAKMVANIANLYREQQDYSQALTYYQKALNALIDHPPLTNVADNPGLNYILQKTEALDIVRDKTLTFLEQYRQGGDAAALLAAEQANTLAIQLVDAIRQSYIAAGSKFVLATAALPVYEQAIEIALARYEQSDDPAFLEVAFQHAERNKAILLLESIQGRRALASSGIPNEVLEQEKSLRLDIAFYEEKINNERLKEEQANDKINSWQEQLFEVREAHKLLVQELEADYPQYYQFKTDKQTVSLARLQQQALETQSLVLEYFVGQHQLYLFEISAQAIQVHRIDNTDLLSRIETLNQQVNHSPENDVVANYQQFTQSAHQLYAQLLSPALKDQPAVQRLQIIGDDVLNALSFGLLLRRPAAAESVSFSARSLDYLLEDYSISYHYSAALLLDQLQLKPSRAKHRFLGYAPSFGSAPIADNRSCSENEVYNLKCNEPELIRITDITGGDIRLGPLAHSRQFIEEAKDYQIIHLATHACIYPEAPQLNRIYFADDYISSYSLGNIDLQADLAVVSACNSGNGKLIRGEGIISLSRDFITAGCAATVTSLWAIDDCASSEVMVGFYEQLSQGLPKDEALRQAQLQYLKGADKLHQHPYFWSAFVQFGQTGALKINKRFSQLSSVLPWVMGLLLVCTFIFFRERARQA